MVRFLVAGIGVLAIITVLAEALAAGLLWSQGRLTPDTVREIRTILRDPDELVTEEQGESDTPRVSLDDVIAARSQRIIDIEGREQEQAVLQALVDDARDTLLLDGETLNADRKKFEEEQQAAADQAQAQSVLQTRNVLLKLDPETAVAQLMELPVDQNVLLLRGMPEKEIAELLQAFSAAGQAEARRGQEIFQAITKSAVPEPGPEDTQ